MSVPADYRRRLRNRDHQGDGCPGSRETKAFGARRGVDDLDDTIGQIRTTIFVLQQSRHDNTGTTRARLLEMVVESRHTLGFEPSLRFAGLLDTVRGDVVDDLVAVLQEALSNIARHAKARAAEVAVTVAHGRLTLEVRDNGIGFTDGGRSSGLTNLRQRAERHHGTLTVERGRDGGTALTWSVPLG